MELALLVWAVSALLQLDNFLRVAILLTIVSSSVSVFFLIQVEKKDWDEGVREKVIKYALLPKTLAFLLLVSWVIPEEKTLKYMAGAYLIQTTYESEFVQKATPSAQKAVLNQLEKWAKDNKELSELMEPIKNANITK